MPKSGEPEGPAALTVELGRRPSPRDPTSESLDTDDMLVPPSPPGSAMPPGTTVGRYVIEEPLGEGGMGVVYRAHDPELGRSVALKLLRSDGADGVDAGKRRSRVVREAHAMAKLNHPNVLAIYDAGVYEDQVFLAVELVDGTTVRGWLGQRPRSWREIDRGRGLDLRYTQSAGTAPAGEPRGDPVRPRPRERGRAGRRWLVRPTRLRGADPGRGRVRGSSDRPGRARADGRESGQRRLLHGDRTRAEALAYAGHDELVNLEVAKDLLAEVDAWTAKTFKARAQ